MTSATDFAGLRFASQARMDLHGVRALVVDDNEDHREVLRLMLESCGASVTHAASAHEAKRVLQEVRPDVLISDVSMPDDGLWLLEEAARLAAEDNLDVPVVAVTANATADKLLAKGFKAIVKKPIDPEEVCRVVAAWTRGRAT